MAVCLHCLHEARVAARDRRQRALLRAGAWTLSFAVVGIVGSAAVNSVLKHPEPPTATRHSRRAQVPRATPHPDSAPLKIASAAPVMQQGAPAAAITAPADSSTHAPVVAESASVPAARAIAPVLPQGRTDLQDSTFAERSGDTVVVHFDTSPLRTRRADKFEMVVRQTLHAVYGTIADTALASIPAGRLAAPNELVTSLPARGVRLTVGGGARLVIWPQTRPGRDGPLVVAYRTFVEH
jgi:hypothetical protein